jgi:hypothetical protein
MKEFLKWCPLKFDDSHTNASSMYRLIGSDEITTTSMIST